MPASGTCDLVTCHAHGAVLLSWLKCACVNVSGAWHCDELVMRVVRAQVHWGAVTRPHTGA